MPHCLLAYRYECNHDGPVGARTACRWLAAALERRLVVGGDAGHRSAAQWFARHGWHFGVRLDASPSAWNQSGMGTAAAAGRHLRSAAIGCPPYRQSAALLGAAA